MWLITAASLTLLPGAAWHPAGGVGCAKALARVPIPVAAAADTGTSSLETRITKVESMLVELKALDVSEELVQSIKDELQAKSEPIHTAPKGPQLKLREPSAHAHGDVKPPSPLHTFTLMLSTPTCRC